MYKYTNTNNICRLSDGAIIPIVVGNKDYDNYVLWVSGGGVTQAADPPDPGPSPIPISGDDDLRDRPKVAQAVTNLEAYLALVSPTNAQTVGAFKIVVRVVLALLKRAV